MPHRPKLSLWSVLALALTALAATGCKTSGGAASGGRPQADYSAMSFEQLKKAAGPLASWTDKQTGKVTRYGFDRDDTAAWHACMKAVHFADIKDFCGPFNRLGLKDRPDAPEARKRFDDALADPDATTRLVRAVIVGDVGKARDALKAGADPNPVSTNLERYGISAAEPERRFTPLSQGVQLLDLEMLDALLDGGADPNFLPPGARSLLPSAGVKKSVGDKVTSGTDVAELLVRRGYKPTPTDIRDAEENVVKKWPTDAVARQFAAVVLKGGGSAAASASNLRREVAKAPTAESRPSKSEAKDATQSASPASPRPAAGRPTDTSSIAGFLDSVRLGAPLSSVTGFQSAGACKLIGRVEGMDAAVVGDMRSPDCTARISEISIHSQFANGDRQPRYAFERAREYLSAFGPTPVQPNLPPIQQVNPDCRADVLDHGRVDLRQGGVQYLTHFQTGASMSCRNGFNRSYPAEFAVIIRNRGI